MWAAERVSRLGRDPDFNSATLKECSHTEYVTVDDADLTRILKELGRRGGSRSPPMRSAGGWMDLLGI
jgi:hypothetical protein